MFKHKKKIIFFLLIVLAGGYFYWTSSKKPKVEYTTVSVERGTVGVTVSVSGTVASQNQVDLSFKTSGKIIYLPVKVGDSVSSGQKVAEIDKDQLFIALRQAELDIKTQKETLDNMKKRDDIYNRDQRDAQRAIIKKTEASVELIRDQLRDTALYSPIDGIVIRKNVELYEQAPLSGPVVTIANLSALELEANVPESDIASVKVGQKVEMTFDAFTSEEKFPGQVTEIEPAATVIQDVVYYLVKFKMDSLDPRLKMGMSADIDIFTDKKDNVLFIPERAVKSEGTQKYVEVLKEDGISVERKNVETGMKGDDGVIEIKSGLNEKEKVITLKKDL